MARDLTRLRSVLNVRREQLLATLARIQQELRATTTIHADAADQTVASYDKNALHHQCEQPGRQLRLLDVVRFAFLCARAALLWRSGGVGSCHYRAHVLPVPAEREARMPGGAVFQACSHD